MAQEKEPKGITRRQFLRGITVLGASALLSSCGVKEEPVSQKPTETLRPAETTPPTKVPAQESSPTPQPALTPESTPTPEITRIVGLTITADYLKNAFAGAGGKEVVTNGQEEVSVVQFGQEYVSQSWGEEINFTKLAEDPVASLKYLISLGAYQGQEGVYSPGKQGEEVIFPQLATLSLARLALKSVPSEMEPKEQDYREQISPLNLTLRPQTQMAIVGLLNEPRPGAEVTVDKEAPGGEPNYALVAFTDYLRASEEGIPRHYLAILPTHLSADPENKNILSLQNLLEANGYQYDHQKKEIIFDNDHGQTALALNQIEGEELTKDLRQAVGLAFVDQIKGELIKNPVVPYPDQMPAVWDIEETRDEEGNVSLLLKSQDQEGRLQDFARAVYDQEKKAWSWEKIFSPEELLAQAPQVEGLRAVWQEDRIIYQAEAGNPYNLESGEYAGYLFEFDDETGVSSGQGLALAGEVRRKLLEQANTPEAIEQGEWRMTFPFDPKGERIRVWHARRTVDSIAINGLPPETKFRSPFLEPLLVKWYIHQGSESIGFFFPNSLLEESKQEINYGVNYHYVSAKDLRVDNFGREVSFDEILFSDIGEKNLPTPPFPAGCQIVIAGGSLSGPIDFSMNRILMVDQAPVFGLDKD